MFPSTQGKGISARPDLERNTDVKTVVALGVLAGLLLATVLIGFFGFGAVMSAFLSVGWGMAALSLYRFLAIALGGFGWRILLRHGPTGPVRGFIYARWVRESMNALLPVAQVGGEIAGARIVALNGAGAVSGAASAVVAKTLDICSLFVFAFAGVALLLHLRSYSATAWTVATGLAVFAPLLLGFMAAQRMGMLQLLERFFAGMVHRFAWLEGVSLHGLHETVLSIYRDRRAVFVSFLCHLASWVTGAGEVWLALHFMGVEIGFAEAFVIESLAQAVRSAGFAIPASLGVQEGGYLAFGMLAGLGPEVALGLSLVRRVRQIAVGVPGLLLWQFGEAKRIAETRNRSVDRRS
jgi:putative membrane protein